MTREDFVKEVESHFDGNYCIGPPRAYAEIPISIHGAGHTVDTSVIFEFRLVRVAEFESEAVALEELIAETNLLIVGRKFLMWRHDDKVQTGQDEHGKWFARTRLIAA